MGLFSFLSGKGTGSQGSEGSEGSGGSGGSEGSAAATASAPSPAPTSAPEVFHAPDAWNTESLLAPKPVQPGEVSQVSELDAAKTAEFQQPIIDVIKTVYDPEIPVDIYELGLIYEIIVDSESRALIKMTLTSPACPSAQQLPQEVRYKVKAVPGITDAWVDIVWEPPWTKDRMSEAAKLTLGIF